MWSGPKHQTTPEGHALVSAADVGELVALGRPANKDEVLELARLADRHVIIEADLVQANRAVDVERRLELGEVGRRRALVCERRASAFELKGRRRGGCASWRLDAPSRSSWQASPGPTCGWQASISSGQTKPVWQRSGRVSFLS